VVAQKFDGVRAACDRAGRAPGSLSLSVALPTYAGATDAEVDRRAAGTGRSGADVHDDVNLVGTPEQIADKVQRLADLGAERVYLQLVDLRDLEHLEFVGTEVLPLLPR
jgi:alkanesulfonate monooxygenase SsuD/methylene tetrahydromethanopterin reductase-like flavin-dependent oxidoreductase (luciferase family)